MSSLKPIYTLLIILALLLSSCSSGDIGVSQIASVPEGTVPEDLSSADLTGMDFSFTDRDLAGTFENAQSLSGNEINITSEGVYIVTGEVAALTVSAPDDAKVQIVLDNAKIGNQSGPAIYIASADKVFITLKEGTKNTVSDVSGYTYSADADADGAIFSRADLTINGSGVLTVNAGNKHGIVSKDDLVIASANVTVNAKNVALSGKDCIKISNAALSLTAGSDGMRADNTDDDTRGFVFIESGKIAITAGNDGIQAETAVKITAAELNITSGGGSGGTLSNSDESFKGIKAASDIIINGGKYTVSSKDDCIHSNNTICITDGEFFLSSGDDGIHADTDLSVSGGNITVSKSYEGLESSRIFISGGNINVTASDDGLNAAGGNDGSALGGRPGMGGFSNGIGEILVSGGYTLVNASGDGLDSNGTFAITGGVVLVSGPTNNGNGAFDYDGSASVTGGVLIALGASGMAQGFSNAENQGAIFTSFTTQAANTSFALCDSDGKAIVSFTPQKAYQSVAVTAPEIQNGGSYKIVCGGSINGADANGFARNAEISGGTALTEITMSSLLYNAGGMGGPGGGMPPGGGRPDGGRPGGRW